MAALPYMPLYVADYLADAAHLSTLEHGAYLLLIMNYWQRGKPLPSDDRKLANIARMDVDAWVEIRVAVEEFFTPIDGEWTHKRIDAELSSVREKSDKARSAGKASAEQRLNGRSTPVQRTLNHTDTDTDTDTNTKSKEEDGATATPTPLDEDPKSVLFSKGIEWLSGFTSGKTPEGKLTTARALTGKWLKEVGGDRYASLLLGIFRDAKREGKADYVGWIQKMVSASAKARAGPGNAQKETLGYGEMLARIRGIGSNDEDANNNNFKTIDAGSYGSATDTLLIAPSVGRQVD